MGGVLKSQGDERAKKDELMMIQAAQKKEEVFREREKRENQAKKERLQHHHTILDQQIAERREMRKQENVEMRVYAAENKADADKKILLEEQKRVKAAAKRAENERILKDQITQNQMMTTKDRILPNRAPIEIQLNTNLLNEIKNNPVFEKEAEAIFKELDSMDIQKSPSKCS